MVAAKVPRPGAITMAHLGVLLLDEIAEFSSATLEALHLTAEHGPVAPGVLVA